MRRRSRDGSSRYRTLLLGFAADPERTLGGLPLLTEAGRELLLVARNATGADYPRDRCVQELIEEQALRTPAG